MGVEAKKLSIAEWIAVTQDRDLSIPLTLHTTSGSMLPTIRMDEDTVVVLPCAVEDVRVGDIVLIRKPDSPAGVVLHRLVRIKDGRLLIRGDNMPAPDGEVGAEALLGRAVSITGPGKSVDCEDPKWRRRAACRCALWPLRPLLRLPRRCLGSLKRIRKRWKSD